MQTSSKANPRIPQDRRAAGGAPFPHFAGAAWRFRGGAGIAFILASGVLLFASAMPAAAQSEPPPGLAKRVAQRASETRQARDNYTYRQSVNIEELTPNGAIQGEYREVREVIFSPQGERTERLVGKPASRLKRLLLTEEDFRDVREVQPFLFTADQLWSYQTQFRGEETVNGVECWILQVRPRQILAGQRLFDGVLWVAKKDASIVRSQGHAVPQIRTTKSENLFPRFTTEWKQVEGGYWFPALTYADDTLDFRVGPQRERLIIRYTDYKRFAVETKVKFNEEQK